MNSIRAFVRSGLLLLCVGSAWYLAQPVVHTQSIDALPFAKSFLVTGNYAVGSVDFNPQTAANGSITATLPMSGVPNGAEVLAAYLYWESISTDVAQVDGVKFRGEPMTVVKRSSAGLTGTTAPCFSSGGGSSGTYTMSVYRSDVYRLLPRKADGTILVNDADLIANSKPLHTVTLPEAGVGNQVPSNAGASLLVVYRHLAQPLTSIVVYDGIAVQSPGTVTSQRLRGFLQSASTPSAKLTVIGGSGANNSTDRLFFKDSLLATNGFVASAAPTSDRSWSSQTHVVTSMMPGVDPADGYGEQVTATIDHTNASPYDCLSIGAMIFSTSVQDGDADGIPDRLEEISGLLNPDGTPLPDLYGMGASKFNRDLFVEMGALQANPGTTYGFGAAAETDTVGHNHLPTPAVIKLIGDAYKNAPGSIKLHVDVGPGYHSLGGAYASNVADEYIIPSGLSRGGEIITEVSCGNTAGPDCQFPGYPGTVSWKIGFQLLRDAPVGNGGEELNAAAMDACEISGTCRRRFDQERLNFFRYILYAHSRGKPKELCITGTAAEQETCRATNPNFHIPSSASGIADFPGGDALVSLGQWGHGFVGSDFVRASTTLHEMGHTMHLSHGGDPALLGQLNCKPNYFSVMNYLFQHGGLRDNDGVGHLDYSRASLPALDENAIVDGTFGYPYRAAWFTPIVTGSLGATLGIPASTRFCNGASLPNPLPAGWVPMGRIESASIASAIDWNGDGFLGGSSAQDVNFDGPASPASLNGFNDWAAIRLDQVGSRRNMAGFSLGMDFTSNDDFSGGDDFEGALDFRFGIDYTGGIDITGGIELSDDIDYRFGIDITGGVDLPEELAFGIDITGGMTNGLEVTREDLAAQGNTPANKFKGCVIGSTNPDACSAGTTGPLHRALLTWGLPDVGTVTSSSLYRVLGTVVTPSSVKVLVGGGAISGPATSGNDPEELAHDSVHTYFVVPTFTDGVGRPSNFSTTRAVNDAPVAVPDAYNVAAATLLTVPARGVLANDTDTDSPLPSLTAVLTTGPSNAASFTLNADGSFTYQPRAGFSGVDTFTYQAKDVTPISTRNVPATVTITVAAAPIQPYTITIDPLRSPANLGSAVTIEWELRNSAGVRLESLTTLLKIESVFTGVAPATGCVASATGTKATLYSPATGATGGSNFRLVGNRFRFNWDSTTANATGIGCYTILITLDDGSAPRMTTPVQLR